MVWAAAFCDYSISTTFPRTYSSKGRKKSTYGFQLTLSLLGTAVALAIALLLCSVVTWSTDCPTKSVCGIVAYLAPLPMMMCGWGQLLEW